MPYILLKSDINFEVKYMLNVSYNIFAINFSQMKLFSMPVHSCDNDYDKKNKKKTWG